MRLPFAGFLVLVVLSAESAAPYAAPQGRPTVPPAVAEGPRPWPSARELVSRKKDAESRRLFQTIEPLEFTLTFDFKAVDRDRDPNSTTTYPATITFPQPDRTKVTRDLKVRGRGHSRRDPKICDFVPLRLEFDKNAMKDTIFEGPAALKLGTHCRSVAAFEQYVLREYSAYGIFSLVTPYSFRARLARVTYVDSVGQRPLGTRFGMFLEDDDDIARRMGGRIVEQPQMVFRHFDPAYLRLMTVFEYLIGNTDVSIYSLHNVKIVETPDNKRYPVPYDFDYSGLVNASYAVVNKALFGASSVRDRIFRGPCWTPEELGPAFEQFRAKKDEILALYATIPGVTDGSRRQSQSYIEDFYRTIDDPAGVRRLLAKCVKEVGM